MPIEIASSAKGEIFLSITQGNTAFSSMCIIMCMDNVNCAQALCIDT